MDHPTSLFGRKFTPYMIIHDDSAGNTNLGGGHTLIIGYTYMNDDYGAQLVLSYNGKLRFRAKLSSIWSDFRAL